MTTADDSPRPQDVTNRRRLVGGTITTLIALLSCLFLPAGTWAWWSGWLFFAVIVTASVVITLYLKRANPEVIAARVNRHEGTKRWDRLLLALFLPAMVSILPVAALDGGRFHLSHVPWWACSLGYVLLLTGLAGLSWAEAVNKFFEPTVRIQADRGHRVIDAGPYALVRHPGYASAFFLVLGMPLALGSYLALIPAVTSYLFLIVRTVLEDRMLRAELPGYEEYARRVRYRLVPGLW